MDQVSNWLDEGIAYKAQGEWSSAAQAFEQALAADPRSAAAYFNMADLAEALGQPDAAVACYRQAIALDPRLPLPYARLGDLLYKHGHWEAAEQCFVTARAVGEQAGIRGTTLEQESKLGMALIHQEKLDAAALVFQRMLKCNPGFAEIHNNLAFVFERQGRLEAALDAARRAVRLKPGYAEGHNNLGVALRALHRLDEARRCFQQAAKLKPEWALAHFNHGTICLLAENYRAGWPGYEWRMLTLNSSPRKFSRPRWDGRPLPGGTLLFHTEQGYGDSIQFVRFVRQAKERSQARIVLEGPAALLSLLANVAGVDECVTAGTALPEYDAELPLPSLPGILQTELACLPGEVPYITASAQLRDIWRKRLEVLAAQPVFDPAEQGGAPLMQRPLKVGIVWQGNPAQAQDVVRSCSLKHFERLAEIEGIVWFSLQKGAVIEAPLYDAAAGLKPIALGPDLNDFGDTAAVLCELDLLISVDTSVAHLAGALGRPVWTLLCHTPDWRWQLDRADSPWYPTMRLFRQPKWGDWPAVFESVARELGAWRAVAEGGSPSVPI